MSNKKINVLVIGGSGFLGSHVVDTLVKKKYNVISLDVKKSKWINKKCKYVIGSYKNKNKLIQIIKNSNIVYNFGGIGDLDFGSKNPLKTITENIFYTAKIIELCIKYNVRRFVYSSTIYVYSDQGSFYKCSKQAAENYIEEYCKKTGLKFTILRFGSLYGPRSNINNGLYKIIYSYLKYKKIIYSGSKKTMREYINVKDAAVSCVDILKKKFENKHIILTGRKKIQVKKLLIQLSKFFGYKNKIIYKNTKDPNHYDINPYTFRPRYGFKYFPKKISNIDDGIKELIDYVKAK